MYMVAFGSFFFIINNLCALKKVSLACLTVNNSSQPRTQTVNIKSSGQVPLVINTQTQSAKVCCQNYKNSQFINMMDCFILVHANAFH